MPSPSIWLISSHARALVLWCATVRRPCRANRRIKCYTDQPSLVPGRPPAMLSLCSMAPAPNTLDRLQSPAAVPGSCLSRNNICYSMLALVTEKAHHATESWIRRGVSQPVSWQHGPPSRPSLHQSDHYSMLMLPLQHCPQPLIALQHLLAATAQLPGFLLSPMQSPCRTNNSSTLAPTNGF